MEIDPRMQGFFRQLVHQAIQAAIQSIFWKMPLFYALICLLLLIGVVIGFHLY